MLPVGAHSCQVQLFVVAFVFEKGGKVISRAGLEHRKGQLWKIKGVGWFKEIKKKKYLSIIEWSADKMQQCENVMHSW